jgi:hypothetical protein
MKTCGVSQFFSFCTAAVFAFPLFPGLARAHPEPDIPIKSQFAKDGSALITIEIDPRCFTADPNTESYLMKAQLAIMTELEKKDLVKQVSDAVQQWIEFHFEPSGKAAAQFSYEFTGLAGAELKLPDDPVVLTGKWKVAVPPKSAGWKIHATEKVGFSVIFRNYLEGVEQPRFSVLFPGETSFVLTSVSPNEKTP